MEGPEDGWRRRYCVLEVLLVQSALALQSQFSGAREKARLCTAREPALGACCPRPETATPSLHLRLSCRPRLLLEQHQNALRATHTFRAAAFQVLSLTARARWLRDGAEALKDQLSAGLLHVLFLAFGKQDLVRVEQTERIECALDRPHERQGAVSQLAPQVLALRQSGRHAKVSLMVHSWTSCGNERTQCRARQRTSPQAREPA